MQIAELPGTDVSTAVVRVQTITRPSVLTLTSYPVSIPDAMVGSFGNAGIYVGVRHERLSWPDPAVPVTILEVDVVSAGQPPPKMPL